MSIGKQIYIYKNKVFLLDEQVYKPESYSIFLEENIILNTNEVALDLMTGSGFLAIMMAEKAKKVVGIDINPFCVKCAKKNVLLNDLENIVEIRQGDLFNALNVNEKYDVIVSCPPLFPTPAGKDRNDWIGKATEGGIDGRKFIDQIIENAAKFLREKGRLQIIHAWYNNIPKSVKILEKLGFAVEITAEQYFPIGHLSYERSSYLKEIGFPLIEDDGKLLQKQSIITAHLG